MKKIIMSLMLCLVLSGWSVAETPAVKKVTYFPLSYAAYQHVNANDMALGVGKQSASASLSGTIPLNVCPEGTCHTTELSNANSHLFLNGGKKARLFSDSATIGDENAGKSKVDFYSDLRLNAGTMSNLNTGNLTVSNLTLFGHEFPTCTQTGHRMKWVKLKLGPTDCCSWYLACVGSDWVSTNECTENGSACTSGLGPITPDEGVATYWWRKTSTFSIPNNFDCPASCFNIKATMGGSSIGDEYLPADYFDQPCNKGDTCRTGNNPCYTYTCEERY